MVLVSANGRDQGKVLKMSEILAGVGESSPRQILVWFDGMM